MRLRIHAVHKVRTPQFVSLALTAQTRLLAILRDWVVIGALNVCTPISKASSTIELVRDSDQELPLAKPTVGVTGRAIKVLRDMLSITAACCYAILVVIAADNCYNIPGEDLRPTISTWPLGHLTLHLPYKQACAELGAAIIPATPVATATPEMNCLLVLFICSSPFLFEA